MTTRPSSTLIRSLIMKGRIFFWLGSMMASSSLSWFLSMSQTGIENVNMILFPGVIMIIGIALALAFKDCNFIATR